MAYAKLTFSSTATVQQKLKDIAKVCTGAATSTAGLEFAIRAESEVVNLEPAGWTMADASSALETTGTATINEYRLQSPCVNTNKIKYCALTVYSSASIALGAVANTQNTRPTSGATVGFLWAPIGSGVSANTLQNPGFVPLLFSNYTSVPNTLTVSNRINIGTALEFFINVTNRKLILFTFAAPSIAQIILNLEFPETVHTTTNNNLPLINISTINFTSSNTNTIVVNGSNPALPGASGGTLNKSAYFTNWFSATTRARSNILADDGLQLHWLPTVPSSTVAANGTPAFPLLPIIDVRTTIGEGIHDYSALTDTYQSFRTSTYNMFGDEFSYLGTTYVFFTIGSNRIIVVKKA